MDTDALKVRAIARVDQLRPSLVDLSLRIHSHPELSLQEFQASEWLTDWLAAEGFAAQRGLGSLPTAFRAEASAGKGGGRVAFLAEYDALPELGHSCGHNIVAAAAVGAAAAVRSVIDDIEGTVLVLGTPGEEGGGGKIIMAREVAFDGLDAALLIFPGIHNIAASRTLAAVGLHIEFFGKAAHAAAHPEWGVNALDALLQGFHGLNGLRQHVRSDTRIHGVIRAGGSLPMVVPDFTSADIIVRANDDAYLDALMPRVLACFQGAAQMTGARLEHRWNSANRLRGLLSNGPLAAAFAANVTTLGRKVQDTDQLGGAWSSDAGNASFIVPIIQPQVEMTEVPVPPHSHQFTAASAMPAAHDCIVTAAKAMAMTAIDLLVSPELREAVWQDFHRGVALGGVG
jgi:amidohydrolase